MIESLSALTLATHDMPCAVRFYTALGFDLSMVARTPVSPVSVPGRAT
jgi:hypothetical protein